MLAAVLDTCVLYSGVRRDFLLSMAAVGVFRVVISEDLLFEIQYVERRKLSDRGVTEAEADRRAARLAITLAANFVIEEPALVNAVRPVGLPDEGDEHVVAAAIVGTADVIVTDNVKDYPLERMPAGIRVQRPDEFLSWAVTTKPDLAAVALREMSRRRRHPPQSELTLIDLMLGKGQISDAAANLLRQNHIVF